MKRFRMTSGDSIGMAVLLLLVALPIVFHLAWGGAGGGDSAAARTRELEAQHRIDSAQQRDDSIRSARDSVRAEKKRMREARRDSERAAREAARRFVPERSRLDERLN